MYKERKIKLDAQQTDVRKDLHQERKENKQGNGRLEPDATASHANSRDTLGNINELFRIAAVAAMFLMGYIDIGRFRD